MEKGKSVLKILASKPKGKITLGRSRCRWEDNSRIDLKEMGINTRNWVDSAQYRYYWNVLVNSALNFRVHKP